MSVSYSAAGFTCSLWPHPHLDHRWPLSSVTPLSNRPPTSSAFCPSVLLCTFAIAPLFLSSMRLFSPFAFTRVGHLRQPSPPLRIPQVSPIRAMDSWRTLCWRHACRGVVLARWHVRGADSELGWRTPRRTSLLGDGLTNPVHICMMVLSSMGALHALGGHPSFGPSLPTILAICPCSPSLSEAPRIGFPDTPQPFETTRSFCRSSPPIRLSNPESPLRTLGIR